MERSDPATLVPAEYLKFIESERVSDKTRAVLIARMEVPALAKDVLSAAQTDTLRAMLARVIPQPEPAIDLTAYVLERLSKKKGDGWRYDILPDDCQAYREGLDRLAGRGFDKAAAPEQDAMLKQLAAGSAVDMRWFEEVRGDATAAYVSHPATLARFGYSGFGVGGASTPHRGFVQLAPNEREDWEPIATARPAR